MREVRVYVEGPPRGDSAALFRVGFSAFLRRLVDRHPTERVPIHVIPSGGREDVLRDFVIALDIHPEATNVLLVDSDREVTDPPRVHLQRHHGFHHPQISDDQFHLMVQIMEAWFLCDPDALQRFFSSGFRRNAIPRVANVESIEASRVLAALAAAVRGTAKRQYHKVSHASGILQIIDPILVCAGAAHCARLKEALERLLA